MANSLGMSSDQKKTLWSVIGVVASLAWGAGSSYALIAVAGFTLAAATGVGAGIAVALLLVVGLFTYFSFRRNNGNNSNPNPNPNPAHNQQNNFQSTVGNSDMSQSVVPTILFSRNDYSDEDEDEDDDVELAKIYSSATDYQNYYDRVKSSNNEKIELMKKKLYLKITNDEFLSGIIKIVINDEQSATCKEFGKAMWDGMSSMIIQEITSTHMTLGAEKIHKQTQHVTNIITHFINDYANKGPDLDFIKKSKVVFRLSIDNISYLNEVKLGITLSNADRFEEVDDNAGPNPDNNLQFSKAS